MEPLKRVDGNLPLSLKTGRDPNSGIIIDGPWRTASDVGLSVHSDLATLRDAWTALEKAGDCTVFQSFVWLSTWFRHVGAREGIQPCVVIGRDAKDDEVLFILPLGVKRGILGSKLVWLGGCLSDYQGPILAKSFSQLVQPDGFPAFWARIRALLPRHDVIDLGRMPEKIGGQVNPFLQLGRLFAHASSAHLTRLKPTWDAYYDEKRSSASKKRDRQKRRKLDEFGGVALVTSTGKAEITETIEALIAQKSASFARMGVANPFMQPGIRDFYMALATETEDFIHTCRLEVGDKIAATNWGVSFGGRYYYVLASYAEQEAFSKRGPGVVQLMGLMKYAIETGHDEFDFTVGDEGYKDDWCEVEIKLYDYMSATTLKGLLTLLPVTAYLKAKRFIKQTPLLWQAFSRLRAAAGAFPNFGPARP